MSIRTEKVASEIKKALAKPISDLATGLNAGLVTLTTVRISPDLKIAKVYISLYAGNIPTAEFIDYLSSRQGYIRHILGTKIRLRYTPELKFFIDDTLDQIEHIQKVLDSAKMSTDDEDSE